MVRIGVVLGCIALAGAVVIWILFRSGVTATSRIDPDITIECSAATAASANDCRAWGDEILVADPAPMTFERKDLVRLAIDRSLLGVGGTCSVAYYLGRYPNDPVWRGEVACR